MAVGSATNGRGRPDRPDAASSLERRTPLPQSPQPLQQLTRCLPPRTSAVITSETPFTTGARLVSNATPAKPTASATATTFVTATTPVATRKTTVTDDGLFCGGYIITSRKRVLPFYRPRAVTLTNSEGTAVPLYLAQASNDAAKFNPILLPGDIVGNIIVPMSGNVTDVPPLFAAGAGAIYTCAELEPKHPAINAANPVRNQAQQRILVLPAMLPMLASDEGGYRGRIDESALDTMDLNVSDSSFWLRQAPNWTEAFQDAVLAVNKKSLGTKWPKLKKANLVWAQSALIDPAHVGDDEREELAHELASLEATIEAIRGPIAPVPVITGEASDAISAVSERTGAAAKPTDAGPFRDCADRIGCFA